MDIGTYVAEKHILDDGVLCIEVRSYVESQSRELIFSIDSEGTIVVSDMVRKTLAHENVPPGPW